MSSPSASQAVSPFASPRRRFSSPRRRSAGCGDRHIPSRLSSKLEEAFDMLEQDEKSRSSFGSDISHENNQCLINNLIRSELLGQQLRSPKQSLLSDIENEYKYNPQNSSPKVLRFNSEKSDRNRRHSAPDDLPNPITSIPLSPVAGRSPSQSPRTKRKISHVPFKVLDAPALQDDFYLNLVDWSSTNALCVGLSSSVYLWSANTSKVHTLKIFPFVVFPFFSSALLYSHLRAKIDCRC